MQCMCRSGGPVETTGISPPSRSDGTHPSPRTPFLHSGGREPEGASSIACPLYALHNRCFIQRGDPRSHKSLCRNTAPLPLPVLPFVPICLNGKGTWTQGKRTRRLLPQSWQHNRRVLFVPESSALSVEEIHQRQKWPLHSYTDLDIS